MCSKPKSLTAKNFSHLLRILRRWKIRPMPKPSLRCKPCVHASRCDGMHINYIRAHGYEFMQPVLADAE